MRFIDEVKKFEPDMIRVRRALHQIPEIGLELPKTVEYVAKELEKLEIEYKIQQDISCIFARIGQGEPCILLRADMDALAVQECSGEEFACTEGRMHACGHDLHAAALLGAAAMLKSQESNLKGCVKLLFQSAEETFEGADAAIKAGILEDPKPQVAYGSHVFSMAPLGEFQYGEIPMGAVYGFKITIHGVGGHGSQPERCIDPINAAVQVYLALQSLIARECPATDEAVLTIGQFKAGEAANIIPQEAVLQGTLRTFKKEIKELLMTRIKEITEAVAAAYRCKVTIETLSNVPSVVNNREFAEFCMARIEQEGISNSIRKDLHLMGSEDFAIVASQVPSCFLCIGAEPEDKKHALGQHNPAIRFNEKAMSVAAAAYAQIAYDWITVKTTN